MIKTVVPLKYSTTHMRHISNASDKTKGINTCKL